jgi:hypothetical protein
MTKKIIITEEQAIKINRYFSTRNKILKETRYYRGGEMDTNKLFTWITPYLDHAKEYGNVTEIEINLEDKNIADPYEIVELVEEFENGEYDPEDLLYQPTTSFIKFLINNGYDGYAIDPDYENIIIFKTIFKDIQIIK